MIDYTYKAWVDRWIDGDTVDLTVDLGFTVWVKQRFRLDGINTPERGKALYKESVQYVNKTAPPGTAVIVKSIKTEKYGRYLGTIFVGDMNINQSLIKEGYAYEYHGEKRE